MARTGRSFAKDKCPSKRSRRRWRIRTEKIVASDVYGARSVRLKAGTATAGTVLCGALRRGIAGTLWRVRIAHRGGQDCAGFGNVAPQFADRVAGRGGGFGGAGQARRIARPLDHSSIPRFAGSAAGEKRTRFGGDRMLSGRRQPHPHGLAVVQPARRRQTARAARGRPGRRALARRWRSARIRRGKLPQIIRAAESRTYVERRATLKGSATGKSPGRASSLSLQTQGSVLQ